MFRILFFSFFLVSCASLSLKTNLQNGSPLFAEHDQGLPRQIITFQMAGLVNKVSRDQQAIFPVLSKLFDMGPSGMTEEEYKQKLFLLNASISFTAAYRTFDVAVVSPPQHVQETMDLALRILRSPKLDEKSLQEAMANTKANTQSAFSSMRTGIMYHAFKDYFKNNPLALNGTASPKSLNALKAETVITTFKKIFDLQGIRVFSVGPIETSELVKKVNHSFSFANINSYQPYEFSTEALSAEEKVQIIHRKGATDHQVLFLMQNNFDLDGREGVVAQAMFEYFGGGLTGKLGMILREERGLTYHASSNYGRFLPSWYIYSFAGSKQLEPLLKGILEVTESSSKLKVTSTELANIKSTLIADFKQSYELPMDTLGLISYASLFDLDVKKIQSFPAEISSLTTSELEAYKTKLLSKPSYSLYVMGDKTVIEPILKRMGYKQISIVDEKDL